jgi:pSer/pThr/pTyr-binding forkhead associated (FHA) protein
LIINGNQVFPLNQTFITIGRRPDSQLVIDDLRVSRVHAQLRAINGRFVIFDLDSTGGTFVNGTLQPSCILSPGDVISLAGFNLVFGQDPTGSTGGFPGETVPYSPQHPSL